MTSLPSGRTVLLVNEAAVVRDRPISRIALTLLLTTLAVAPAPAQHETRQGEKYALLVGVRAYDPNELHDLMYSEADVTGLARVLKAGGYESGNVVLMTQSLGATKPRLLPLAATIRNELRLLLRDLEPEDSVVVAFAGHGVQFAGEKSTYFCPADTKLADRSSLVPLDDVYKELEACKAGLKLLLVDACRNDPRTKNSRSRAEVELESLNRPQVAPPPGGVLAFFSCSEGEKAQEYEELGHGVFFHFVIQGLEGGADLDADGQISAEELAQFAKRRVRDYVREKNSLRQMPELRGTSRGLVPLVKLSRLRVPDVAPPRPTLTKELPAPITQQSGNEAGADPDRRVHDGLVGRRGCRRRREAGTPRADHPAALPGSHRSHRRTVPWLRRGGPLPHRGGTRWQGGPRLERGQGDVRGRSEIHAGATPVSPRPTSIR